MRSSPVEERDEDEREKEDVDGMDREGEWVVVLEEVDVLVGLPTEDVGNHRIPQGDAWVGGRGQGEAGESELKDELFTMKQTDHMQSNNWH